MDRQRQEQKSAIDNVLVANLEPMLQRLVKIALKSDSDKTSLDAIQYAINRLAGTPTNKTQDVTKEEDSKANVEDIDNLLEEYNDNVIELKAN